MRKLSHDLAVPLTGTLSREMKAEETHLTANSAGTAAQTQASPRDEHANDANTLCAGTSVALKTEVLKRSFWAMKWLGRYRGFPRTPGDPSVTPTSMAGQNQLLRAVL